MIRRVFWLSVGAAAGITSYRRATAVGRAISVRVTGDRPAAVAGPFWPPQPNGTGDQSAAVAGPFWPPQPNGTGDQSAAVAGPFWPPQPNGTGQRPGSGQTPAAAGAPSRPQGRPPAVGHPSPRPRPHPQWSTARAAWRTSRAAWRTQKAAMAQVRAAGRFAHDVREGMDLYMNRQEGQPGPNLAGEPRATGAPGTTGTNGRPRGRVQNVKDGR